MKAHRDRGQATVELALSLPLFCILVLVSVQVAVVVGDRLAVQLAAREAARAAVASSDPDAAIAAAAHATGLAPLRVTVEERSATVTATVRYTERTDVGIVGVFVPDVELSASVTMAKEPP